MTRIRILVPVFFARFFDNEMAAGAGSLKTPFFWLVAFLAAPGMFMPVMMSFSWGFVAQYHGFSLLNELVRADKAVYLGYSACASGLMISTVWNSLLLDRRDGLVLGALPVTGPEVVRAKPIALLGYFLLLMIAINAGGSLAFGFFLPPEHALGMLSAAFAHLIASSAYGMFVCISAVAVQGLALMVGGGRGHAKLSPLLQLVTTAVVLSGFFLIDDIGQAVVGTVGSPDAARTIAGAGVQAAPWILSTPTMWFLGLYEVILGFREPIFVTLALRAIAALALVTVVAVVSLPFSYQRLMIAAVEQSPRARRPGLVSRLSDLVARCISHDGPTCAVADFFLITVLRHNRPRLPIALALGASAAWVLSVTSVSLAKGVPPEPTVALFGTPMAVMFFLVIGLRVAASLPSELAPKWLFDVHSVSDRIARRAVRRVTLLFAVLVPTVISGVVFAKWWGNDAFPHALLCLTTGFLIVEAAFIRFEGVPCARIFHPEDGNLRAWWPAYLAAFATITTGLSEAELSYRADPAWLWGLVAAPLAASIFIRIANSRIVHAPPPNDDDLPRVQVLDI